MKDHWETVYVTKGAHDVSWYRPHLDTSLELIEKACGGDRSTPILDAGGGASTLVDDLLDQGYTGVSVLDISQAAIDLARARLGARAERVHWLCADVLRAEFAPGAFGVWHDRAVFHFLTDSADRIAYVRATAQALRPGGFAIVGTFGPKGPGKCSGLDVVRYDAQGLHDRFGSRFHLLESREEWHATPFGTTQQFVYCYCARQAS